VGEQPPLPRNLVQPPGAVENMLGTAPVPFRLRSIEDSERVYRLRQTSFIGRSHRQMREEDLRGGWGVRLGLVLVVYPLGRSLSRFPKSCEPKTGSLEEKYKNIGFLDPQRPPGHNDIVFFFQTGLSRRSAGPSRLPKLPPEPPPSPLILPRDKSGPSASCKRLGNMNRLLSLPNSP
jgi:hypothetical protein